VLVKDEATGYYTAYFAEIPEAVAQGKTQKEAKENLLQIVPFALRGRREDELSRYKILLTIRPKASQSRFMHDC
jgi:predicted RNase H-like HicB family nuclease